VTLAAVRDGALGNAHEEADAIRRGAQQRADQLLAGARAEADALVAARRAAAQRLTDQEEGAQLARARAAARVSVLKAQRAVLDEAAAAAHTAVRNLVRDRRDASLMERLSADARARLAGHGTVEVIAAPGGGIVARAGSRELDYSFDALTGRCLQGMAGELERLWR
jgi:vacuolar-type H+-ATPase subunit E/Vma4